MVQGTTPTHEFILSYGADMIADVEITYKQGNEIILQKHLEDCTVDGNTYSVTLTQEETFDFEPNKMIEVQLRTKTHGGQVLPPSPVFKIECKPILADEVM